jgi:hypothetical protein
MFSEVCPYSKHPEDPLITENFGQMSNCSYWHNSFFFLASDTKLNYDLTIGFLNMYVDCYINIDVKLISLHKSRIFHMGIIIELLCFLFLWAFDANLCTTSRLVWQIAYKQCEINFFSLAIYLLVICMCSVRFYVQKTAGSFCCFLLSKTTPILLLNCVLCSYLSKQYQLLLLMRTYCRV